MRKIIYLHLPGVILKYHIPTCFQYPQNCWCICTHIIRHLKIKNRSATLIPYKKQSFGKFSSNLFRIWMNVGRRTRFSSPLMAEERSLWKVWKLINSAMVWLWWWRNEILCFSKWKRMKKISILQSNTKKVLTSTTDFVCVSKLQLWESPSSPNYICLLY